MSRLAAGARILWAALREIFDESAYSRFLERRHLASSSRAYAAFCRERESSLGRKIKCC